MRVRGRSDVDPKRIRINIRYTKISKVPPDVMAAQKQLVADLEPFMPEGKKFPDDVRLGITIAYTMNDRKADLDGPSKRTIDQVAAAWGFNDSRIDHIRIIRNPVGTPGIEVEVYTIEDRHLPDHVPAPDEEWEIGVGEIYVTEGNFDVN